MKGGLNVLVQFLIFGLCIGCNSGEDRRRGEYLLDLNLSQISRIEMVGDRLYTNHYGGNGITSIIGALSGTNRYRTDITGKGAVCGLIMLYSESYLLGGIEYFENGDFYYRGYEFRVRETNILAAAFAQ